MGRNDVITLVVPIKSKASKKDEVRSRLLDLASKTVREEGNIMYEVSEQDAKPGEFIIYEKWKGQAALDFHMSQEYLKKFLADGPELLEEEIKGIFCKTLI